MKESTLINIALNAALLGILILIIIGNKVSVDRSIIAKTRVYGVQLDSRRRIFAVEGGFTRPIKNVYAQELPDAETASRLHLYTIAAVVSNSRREELKEIAEWLDLPERFIRTDSRFRC